MNKTDPIGTISIRPAVVADIPAIAVLCAEVRIKTYAFFLPPESIPDLLQSQKITATKLARYTTLLTSPASEREQIVALYDGTIVGYYSCRIEGKIIHLTGLFVDERYQGRGIGRMLMEYFLTKYQGVTFRLRVLESNRRAIAMYEKFGFTVVNRDAGTAHGMRRIEMQL